MYPSYYPRPTLPVLPNVDEEEYASLVEEAYWLEYSLAESQMMEDHYDNPNSY